MYIYIFIYSFIHLIIYCFIYFLFIYCMCLVIYLSNVYIYIYIDIYQIYWYIPGSAWPVPVRKFPKKRKLALRNQLPSGQKPFVFWTAGCPLEASDYRQYAMFHLRKLKARWRQRGSAWEPIQDQFTFFSKVNPYWNDSCSYYCYYYIFLLIIVTVCCL